MNFSSSHFQSPSMLQESSSSAPTRSCNDHIPTFFPTVSTTPMDEICSSNASPTISTKTTQESKIQKIVKSVTFDISSTCVAGDHDD